jgi:hypothetical protein
MNGFAFSGVSFWRVAVLGSAVVLGCAALQQASAAAGPFADFAGAWDGSGKIRIGDKTERIRCKAKYSLPMGTGNYVMVQLTCASDSYKFDLSGEFQSDQSNQINGSWSESSRGVGGTASGSARGERFQLHFESSAITGNLVMVTRASSQSVTIDTIGTADKISATIALNRTSRN